MPAPHGYMAPSRATHAACPACGLLAPVAGDPLVIGVHGDADCPATGLGYAALRRIARQAGSWAVRWAEGGEDRERPCGEREAAREAARLGGIAVSPAVRRHLRMDAP